MAYNLPLFFFIIINSNSKAYVKLWVPMLFLSSREHTVPINFFYERIQKWELVRGILNFVTPLQADIKGAPPGMFSYNNPPSHQKKKIMHLTFLKYLSCARISQLTSMTIYYQVQWFILQEESGFNTLSNPYIFHFKLCRAV